MHPFTHVSKGRTFGGGAESGDRPAAFESKGGDSPQKRERVSWHPAGGDGGSSVGFVGYSSPKYETVTGQDARVRCT